MVVLTSLPMSISSLTASFIIGFISRFSSISWVLSNSRNHMMCTYGKNNADILQSALNEYWLCRKTVAYVLLQGEFADVDRGEMEKGLEDI